MIFCRVQCVTGNSWLDFVVDPDYDEDTGIFKGILAVSV